MYIADLHIHSRYSMATSKFLTPEYLESDGASKKGHPYPWNRGILPILCGGRS